MSNEPGTGRLIWFTLRRDRIQLPLWIVGLGGMIASSALTVPNVYDSPQKVAGYAATVGASPVSYLMSGRQTAIDTIGGITANEVSQVAQLGVCLMVMFQVVRHTRTEEETGRAELLRSTVLGRHAAALATLAYAVLTALTIGLVTSGAMLVTGLGATGSLTYGAGLVLLGICYAAVALVAAQLSTSARGALGIAGAAIALGYLVRGVGAMQNNALVWLSPFGWAQLMNAFGNERWWPAIPLIATTAALLGLAAYLTAHRDFGSGMLQPRRGHPRASPGLASSFGLALRLQRGTLIGWAVGLFLLGLLYGAVVPTVPDLVKSNPDIGQFIGASTDAEKALIDAFLRYILLFMAVVCTGFAVSSVLRLRSEEESGRAEAILATGVSRTAWVAATGAVAGLGSLGLVTLMGVGLAVGYGMGMGEWDQVVAQVAEQLTYLPGVLVVAAFAVAVAGLLPRRAMLAWILVAAVVFQTMLGETLHLPDVVNAVSPFWHLPGVPDEPFDPIPGVVELLLACALVVLGLWGYRRRDLAST
jgi:polyether ionophore transport system permease protein